MHLSTVVAWVPVTRAPLRVVRIHTVRLVKGHRLVHLLSHDLGLVRLVGQRLLVTLRRTHNDADVARQRSVICLLLLGTIVPVLLLLQRLLVPLRLVLELRIRLHHGWGADHTLVGLVTLWSQNPLLLGLVLPCGPIDFEAKLRQTLLLLRLLLLLLEANVGLVLLNSRLVRLVLLLLNETWLLDLSLGRISCLWLPFV